MSNSSPGERTLYGFWLSPYLSTAAHMLEESGLPYRYERVSAYTGSTHSPEHKARNPVGKIPSLVEENGFCISDSQSICRYLARTYPQARAFYPCEDIERCARVDEVNDFLTFSVLGPFFNWFVMGAYFPQAFKLQTQEESRVFSLCSSVLTRGNLNRLPARHAGTPFLLGDTPVLPDFSLFYTLELGRLFAELFSMPEINLLSGDDFLKRFYDTMRQRPATQKILAEQASEYPETRRELFEEFGPAYNAGVLKGRKERLEAVFGHAL